MKKEVEVVELNNAMEKELIDLSQKLSIKDVNQTQMILFDIFYGVVSDNNLEMFKNFMRGKYKK